MPNPLTVRERSSRCGPRRRTGGADAAARREPGGRGAVRTDAYDAGWPRAAWSHQELVAQPAGAVIGSSHSGGSTAGVLPGKSLTIWVASRPAGRPSIAGRDHRGSWPSAGSGRSAGRPRSGARPRGCPPLSSLRFVGASWGRRRSHGDVVVGGSAGPGIDRDKGACDPRSD